MKFKFLVFLFCLFIVVLGLSVVVEKMVYGLNEYVCINDLDIQLVVKFDIGVKIVFFSVCDIKCFKCDGEIWVCFYLVIDNVDDILIEKFLVWISKIKCCYGDFNFDEGKVYIVCLVIELQVCMGKVICIIEVNLID